MASPRFSKTCTQRFCAPSSVDCVAQRSTTSRTPAGGMSVSVRSWRGEKHRTRQVPVSASATRRPSARCSSPASGRSAAKSLVKTKVEAYSGLRAPLARVLPGQR